LTALANGRKFMTNKRVHPPAGGGLGEKALRQAADKTLEENAGAAGGTDSLAEGGDREPKARMDEVFIARPEDKEIVGEAAAIDESPRPAGPAGKTIGDALASSRGRDLGSGTKPDRGELGSGGPLDQGSASPGREDRG
jgi:hypothetical protein